MTATHRQLLVRTSLVFTAAAFLLSAVPAPVSADTVHLLVVGTNDLHGALASREESNRSKTGGLALLTGYVNVLRRENPGRVIWLDAGDEFQGSIESNSMEGEPVVRALNIAGVTAATIGNHEFDFGPAGADDDTRDPLGALRARIAQARYPFLAANITSRSSGTSPFSTVPGSVVIDVSGIRVGIIGIVTPETSTATWPPYVKDLEFGDMRDATLRESERLRAQNAEVVLLVAHAGIRCDASAPCNGELVDVIRSLPSGTVDAVVSGHSHSVVAARVGGIPVIQGGMKGAYLNVIDLPFDRETRRVLHDEVRIEGPVAVRAPAVFHGRRVKPDSAVARYLRPILARSKPVRSRVVSNADRALDRSQNAESAMGNLVTDAVRDQSGADFAFFNAGGIRTHVRAGAITYGDVFEALPFENRLVVLRVTGRQLKTIIRVAQSGAAGGYFPLSGLHATIRQCTKCPADDLDGDGGISPWEADRLIDVTRADGTPIIDDATYMIATVDFVLLGGDFMGWPLGRVAPDQIRYLPILARDALAAYLAKHPRINTASAPLVDPARPRVVFVAE